MRLGNLLLAAFLVAGFSSLALAEPADVVAAVAATDRSSDMRKIDEGRKPVEVLSFLGLMKGDQALDLFGSNAYWGLIMARAVGPTGLVDVWESENFVGSKVKDTWARLHDAVPNLSLLHSPAASIQLPQGKYDFVMFNLNYHDLYWESDEYKFPRMDPKPFVRALYRSMKPGATMAVIDHVASPGGSTRDVAQRLHRIDPATVRHDFEAAGFRFEAESSLLRNPADNRKREVFDPAIRFHTDRIIYRFRKPS